MEFQEVKEDLESDLEYDMTSDEDDLMSNISSQTSTSSSSSDLEMIAILLASDDLGTRRARAVIRERASWRQRVAYALQEGSFTRMFRMQRESFLFLLHYIAPQLTVNTRMARIAGQGQPEIDPEMMLLMTIRWLAHGSVHDIRSTFGCSEPSFYRVLHRTLQAIVSCQDCPGLQITFPATLDEMRESASAFRALSTDGIMVGVIGAIDGWFCAIKCPRQSERVNQRSFYSGNYGSYGVNVQAVCDSMSRFTYLSVQSPGSTNDVVAFETCSLSQRCKSFPPSFHLVGDNAYVCNESMITPYSGSQKNDPTKDSFNFYVSQVRIKIEQAFGLVRNKWRIFNSPLSVKLQSVGVVINAAFRLHNFCINQRDFQTNMIIDIDNHIPEYDKYIGDEATLLGNGGRNISMRREQIRRYLEERGIQRPLYNIQRNMAQYDEE